MDSPEVTRFVLEDRGAGRREHVAWFGAEFCLGGLKGGLGTLDGVALCFVRVAVGDLVRARAVENDGAALAAREFGCCGADGTLVCEG